MILLHIVMVSPGTHLVKNHESQSRTSESQLKKNQSEIEMLGPLCNQTVNLKYRLQNAVSQYTEIEI